MADRNLCQLAPRFLIIDAALMIVAVFRKASLQEPTLLPSYTNRSEQRPCLGSGCSALRGRPLGTEHRGVEVIVLRGSHWSD